MKAQEGVRGSSGRFRGERECPGAAETSDDKPGA